MMTFMGPTHYRRRKGSGDAFEELRAYGLVELVADDPRGRYSHYSPLTNDRGEFTFMAIPPGTYLAGVNIARQPAPGSPFRPTYFPGTTDRLQATPIVVRSRGMAARSCSH